ncbi:hypothetical protein TrVE_jg12219 [Triparma verrucosa]|nr:hypothetical protein TrST_g8717 [Triparma strigata]GMI00363.1 hypothetical protein TrVE_jg12219 [Triparma verrucosa]
MFDLWTQGLFAIILSLTTGIIGRVMLDHKDAKKSYHICLACIGVKMVAMAVFIYWGLWLSLGFTAFMALVWLLRALRYRKIFKILESDENMDQYSLMNNGVV